MGEVNERHLPGLGTQATGSEMCGVTSNTQVASTCLVLSKCQVLFQALGTNGSQTLLRISITWRELKNPST